MRPTRLRTLLALAVVAGLLGWLLTRWQYEHLELPLYGPLTAGLMAAFELGLARVVSQKVRGLSLDKPMHPLQVARAAVLAKASSAGGSLLVGFYAGYLVHVFPSDLRAAGQDRRVALASLAASVLLVVAARLLERASSGRLTQPALSTRSPAAA